MYIAGHESKFVITSEKATIEKREKKYLIGAFRVLSACVQALCMKYSLFQVSKHRQMLPEKCSTVVSCSCRMLQGTGFAVCRRYAVPRVHSDQMAWARASCAFFVVPLSFSVFLLSFSCSQGRRGPDFRCGMHSWLVGSVWCVFLLPRLGVLVRSVVVFLQCIVGVVPSVRVRVLCWCCCLSCAYTRSIRICFWRPQPSSPLGSIVFQVFLFFLVPMVGAALTTVRYARLVGRFSSLFVFLPGVGCSC
jgi:hypothetical protein